MNRATVEKVIRLCDDVKGLAVEVLQADADAQTKGWTPIYYGSKVTGALRRRSMDLTRALAEMRKS